MLLYQSLTECLTSKYLVPKLRVSVSYLRCSVSLDVTEAIEFRRPLVTFRLTDEWFAAQQKKISDNVVEVVV